VIEAIVFLASIAGSFRLSATAFHAPERRK
jgi:hypothetical protein